MYRLFSRTLIRTTAIVSPFFKPLSTRCIATQVQISLIDLSGGSDPLMVERIEDAIENMFIRSFEPVWLPFRPGASYWVPPRQSSYGAANNIVNPLNEDEGELTHDKLVDEEGSVITSTVEEET